MDKPDCRKTFGMKRWIFMTSAWHIAKAILKAKNDALEEAATIASDYDGLGRDPSEGASYGDASLTQLDIAQAIRNLKHEG